MYRSHITLYDLHLVINLQLGRQMLVGSFHLDLRLAYTKYTRDVSLSESPDCKKCIRLILNLCLSEGFDTFPTLLCTDGCSMIDR
jgi:hypothetical protein